VTPATTSRLQHCLEEGTVRKLVRVAAEPAIVAAALYRELVLSVLTLIRPTR